MDLSGPGHRSYWEEEKKKNREQLHPFLDKVYTIESFSHYSSLLLLMSQISWRCIVSYPSNQCSRLLWFSSTCFHVLVFVSVKQHTEVSGITLSPLFQFVPFRDYIDRSGNHILSMARLAKDVLAEIPEQFLSYMRARGIKPSPAPPPYTPPTHVLQTQIWPCSQPSPWTTHHEELLSQRFAPGALSRTREWDTLLGLISAVLVNMLSWIQN